VILHVILSVSLPFEGQEDDITKLLKEFRDNPSQNELLAGACWRQRSAEVKDLIKGLLQDDVSKRTTIEQAFMHPWLRELRKSKTQEGAAQDDAHTVNRPCTRRSPRKTPPTVDENTAANARTKRARV